MFKKFPKCLASEVLGKQVDDGTASFLKALKLTIENKCRSAVEGASKSKSAKKAKKGTGTVGILSEQYNPPITGLAKDRQIVIRDHMKNLHDSHNINWTGTSIIDDLSSTYELQRDDILAARSMVDKEKQKENESSNSDEANEENDDPTMKVPALKALRDSWPCLFTEQGLHGHHVRLAGRDIRPHLEQFKEEHEPYVKLFLTSNSWSNTKNLSLRLKAEKDGSIEEFPKAMLLCFMMVANHFQEDVSIILKTAEVTYLKQG